MQVCKDNVVIGPLPGLEQEHGAMQIELRMVLRCYVWFVLYNCWPLRPNAFRHQGRFTKVCLQMS